MSKLSHLNDQGEAHMVDVSDKEVTSRTAVAEGSSLLCCRETLALVTKGEAKKGDVLATARIAGIMAAKKTHELIPLPSAGDLESNCRLRTVGSTCRYTRDSHR